MSTLCRSFDGDDRESSNGPFLHFPNVVDEKIDTNEFLKASRELVKLIEKFGKLFAPVKYDMQGNIEKLNARFVTDEKVNGTLQDMILQERAMGDGIVAMDALLWLTRALHMIQSFFEKIVDDDKNGKATEDLVATLKKSYEECLEPYHGWMAKQLFGLLSRMVPSRTHILQMLANDVPNNEESTLRAMDDFTRRLKHNVTCISNFYAEHGLLMTRNFTAA